MHTYKYTYIHTYKYIHTCMHTFIHTHINRGLHKVYTRAQGLYKQPSKTVLSAIIIRN